MFISRNKEKENYMQIHKFMPNHDDLMYISVYKKRIYTQTIEAFRLITEDALHN